MEPICFQFSHDPKHAIYHPKSAQNVQTKLSSYDKCGPINIVHAEQ